MLNRYLTMLALCAINLLSFTLVAQERNVDPSSLDVYVRSIPAVGFFPLGGTASFKENIFGTYIGGIAVDLINRNITTTDRRVTYVNLSTYLIGLNFNALKPESEAKFFNLAYIRVGPYFRIKNLWTDKFSLGGQFGYGAVLLGDIKEAKTKYQHGFDISFSITHNWIDKNDDEKPCPDVSGTYTRSNSDIALRIEQSGCNITSTTQVSEAFDHTLTGKYNKEKQYFEYINIRRDRQSGCETKMIGRLYIIDNYNIRTEVVGSDGKCGLPANFTEVSIWSSR